MKLLTFTNAKTVKGEPLGYLTAILHLAPAKLSGVNVCPSASPACIRGCLNTSGHGYFDNVKKARRERTEFFNKFPEAFKHQLILEIEKAVKRAKKLGLRLAVRLNGTSDLPELAIEMANKFPSIIFYDYTAIESTLTGKLPENYHITFSRKENNQIAVHKALELGFNVSVLFEKGNRPKTFLGRKVIDGDIHDLRFLDERNVIIGLTPKGNAIKGDKSGFVWRKPAN